MRKLINIVEGRHDKPSNSKVAKSASAVLKDGRPIRLDYVLNAQQMHKHCYVCDSVEAFIDGEKVGYLKFDWSDPKLVAEYPTNYHIIEDWTGTVFSYELKVDVTYETVDLKRLRAWAEEALNKVPVPNIEQRHPIIIGRRTITAEASRPELIALLVEIDHSKEMKEKVSKSLESIEFSLNKPFVAYSQTGMSAINGVHTDNRGKGIGALLYREAAKWIIERGIGKGLYESGIQSGDAKIIWEVFDSRGMVHQDGDRRYLAP